MYGECQADLEHTVCYISHMLVWIHFHMPAGAGISMNRKWLCET